MEKFYWENEKKEVLDTISRYIDITITPFGKPKRSIIEVDKYKTTPENTSVIYKVSLFEKGNFTTNQVGTYIILLTYGDRIEYHDYKKKVVEEHYIIVHGEGKYIEKTNEYDIARESNVQKGNITSNQGENNYHSFVNTGDEPLIIFVVTVHEPVEKLTI